MKNKDKLHDPLPETFATVEEAGEFWIATARETMKNILSPEMTR